MNERTEAGEPRDEKAGCREVDRDNGDLDRAISLITMADILNSNKTYVCMRRGNKQNAENINFQKKK